MKIKKKKKKTKQNFSRMSKAEQVFGHTGLSKQYRSGSTLFATHPAFFFSETSTGIEMDFFKAKAKYGKVSICMNI